MLCISQTCIELDRYYTSELKKKFTEAKTLKEKKDCIHEMRNVIRQVTEMKCGCPVEKWKKEISGLEKSLIPKTVFEQSSYSASYEEGYILVELKYKSIKLLDYPNWLETIENEDSKKVLFYIHKNPSLYEREGVIIVEYRGTKYECSIVQEASPLFANVTEHIGFAQDGGYGKIFVETNDTYWSVSSNANWIKTTRTDFGATVECENNPTKKKRSARIEIKFACGKTQYVNVEQAIGRTTLSVPQKTVQFNNFGGTNSNVVVNCNYDQWTATTDANWIKVERKYGGIRITCDKNYVANSRTATVTIKTNDAENLKEYITVIQSEAEAYINVSPADYSATGEEEIVSVNVTTNIPEWDVRCIEGASWAMVRKTNQNTAKVYLERNDENNSRTAVIKFYGHGKEAMVRLHQPNRGYRGRFKDYYAANGDSRWIWLSLDFHNISFMSVRYKSLEVPILNMNMDYFQDEFYIGLEPVLRGYAPISRNGKWAAFVGMGLNVGLTDDNIFFLYEMGVERQWNDKYSSRMFFKYNGNWSLGISFDMGSWH